MEGVHTDLNTINKKPNLPEIDDSKLRYVCISMKLKRTFPVVIGLTKNLRLV